VTAKKNTKAEFMLTDLSFDHEDAEISYTLGSGAASGKNDAFILKSDDTPLGDKAQAVLDEIKKSQSYTNDLRRNLETALEKKLKDVAGCCVWPWVKDFNDTSVIYETNDITYQRSYTENNGVVTLGDDPKEVVVSTDYIAKSKESTETADVVNVDKKSTEVESPVENLDEIEKGTLPNKINDEDTMSDITVEALLKAQEEQVALNKALEEKLEAVLKSTEASEAALKEQIAKAAEKEKVLVVKAITDEVTSIAGLSTETRKDVVKAIVPLHGQDSYNTIMKAFEEITKSLEAVAVEEVGAEGTDEEITKAVDDSLIALINAAIDEQA
jgi:hypothetical protein